MAAYVIADVTVTDPDTYEEYRKGVPASLAAYGGRFLVRGGDVQVIEGGWQPTRMVVLEFPTAEARRQWYDSEIYQRIVSKRWQAAHSNVVFVDGVE